MRRHKTSAAEFSVMYDLRFDSVARCCLRRIPKHSARDAVSDVLLTAWRMFDAMRPWDQSLPRLYGVAKNLVRNIDRSGRPCGSPHLTCGVQWI